MIRLGRKNLDSSIGIILFPEHSVVFSLHFHLQLKTHTSIQYRPRRAYSSVMAVRRRYRTG